MRTLAAVLAAGLMAAVLAATSCRPTTSAPADGKVHVVATIFPIADVTARIGGDRVNVQMLLDPGQNPHSFVMKPQHVEMLNHAKLLVMVGLGIDGWADRAAESSKDSSGLRVLKLAEDPAFQAMVHKEFPAVAPSPETSPAEHEDADKHDGHAEEGSEHHHHGAGDPHVWLNPVFMEQFVGQIAESLAAVDPAGREEYFTRRDEYIKELRQLDQDYRRQLAGVKTKYIVTYHAAFTYIALRYGLEAMSLLSTDAASLGPRRMQEMIDLVRRHNIKVIFAEPQFNPRALQSVAESTGARLDTLDPEGSPTARGYDSYLSMMRTNLATLVKDLNE